MWDNQIWLTSAPEVQVMTPDKPRLDKPIELSAVCVDYDSGKIVHDIKLFEMLFTPQVTHATNGYGSPTPYIEEGRVYIHFGAYGTACLDTKTFRTIWERRDLECDHFRGPGSSPIVVGDLLYLTFDGFDVQYLAALNKITGKTVWRKDREVDFRQIDGDAKKAYSTPILIKASGPENADQSVRVGDDCLRSEVGQTVVDRPSRWHGVGKSKPLFGNGLVYINSADGPNPLIAVPPEGEKETSPAKIAWRTKKAVRETSFQKSWLAICCS